MSSCLNSLSAVTWEDILKPLIGDQVTETTGTWITRGLVVLYGASGIGFAFVVRNFGGTVLQASISFTGAAAGPLLGIFLLGAMFPWANYIGCVIGGLVGLALPLWISIGAYNLPSSGYSLDFPMHNCTPEGVLNVTTTTAATVLEELSGLQILYTVSYLWYPSIGVATAVIVGMVISLITGPTPIKKVDPKYLIPFFDRLFCCLPESLRRTLRCGLELADLEELQHPEKCEEICLAVLDGEVQPNGVLVSLQNEPLSDIDGRVIPYIHKYTIPQSEICGQHNQGYSSQFEPQSTYPTARL